MSAGNALRISLEDRLNWEHDMPKLGGAVIDPRYVPEHLRDAYVAQWREWARRHERRDWPAFIVTLAAEASTRAKKAAP